MKEIAKAHIVIADHNAEEARVIADALGKKGYTIEVCATGEEALARILEGSPDCIISEVELPRMDGYELCAKIRAVPRLEHVPFIFISPREKNGEETIRGLRLGADDFVNRPVIPDEIILRVQVILRRLQILRTLTITDEITGLFNRRYFDQRLDEEIERLKRYNRPLALWVIDIDNFKKVNDTYGHATGDTTLEQVGNHLQRHLRRSDVLARYGGDEFAIIMPEHPEEGVPATGERLRCSVEDLSIAAPDTPPFSVTISLGGVWISEACTRSANDLIRMADSQLYAAKNNGRNRVEYTRCAP